MIEAGNTVEEELEEDAELLASFIRTGAEGAFVVLMKRHSGGVYGTALRIVRSPQIAEEVTQVVFIELAQRAANLRRGLILASWLHRVTRSRAIDALRRESRRNNRERAAFRFDEDVIRTVPSEAEALLDEAIASLGEKDRSAVFLRFFEHKSISEVGITLGVSADAAQQRVARSVEHLRRFYSRRGHAVGAAGMSAALTAVSATAVPFRLCNGIQAAVTAAKSAPAGVSGFLPTLVMSFGSKILIATLVVASATIGFLFYQSHGEGKSGNPGLNLAANSEPPAQTDTRSPIAGPKVIDKAFIRPRLDEAGKRNLAENPAGVLTRHEEEEKWDSSDDDLLVAWAAKDPQAAMAWVAGKEGYAVQAQLLGAVATGILLRDGPDAARRFLSEHKEDERLRPKDRDNLETYLFMHLGREDTIDLAMQMLDAGPMDDPAADADEVGEDPALTRNKKNAGALIAGIDGSRNIAAAIDYLEAKGYPMDVDYWTFQSVFADESEFWSDWALQRNSDLMDDIVQSWARDHPAEARAWIEKNLPEGDARRKSIDELLEDP